MTLLSQRTAAAFLTAALLFLSGFGLPAEADEHKAVLVVTADASDYILAAGGTIAKMLDDGAAGVPRAGHQRRQGFPGASLRRKPLAAPR